MAAAIVPNVLPIHDSKSQAPKLFDGTPRLYVSLSCPYAQRVFTARNFKGLNDIQVVPINLQDKPDWYKEKVYPPSKVPALEYNGEVKGESLDLLEYLDSNFDGPKLYPPDPAKMQILDELLKFVDVFTKTGYTSLKKPDPEVPIEFGPVLDHLENTLGKFDDGPFFVGEFSVVDCAYAPFLERFLIAFPHFKKYDPLEGRPKLSKYVEELNKVNAYANTKVNPDDVIYTFKTKFNLSSST